ncbi:dihydrofolate reductase [bacterium]|nr:dihydrofolate reductase [bacterium]
MATSCHVFIATSIDGFIARNDGSIDWLEEANSHIPDGQDCGYSNFFSQMDCIIMGRKTFEKVLSFVNWPYGDKKVFVMSRQKFILPHSTPTSVTLTKESPEQLIDRLQSSGIKKAYVDGGQTIQSFLESNLIADLTITRIPIILGEGIPLFGRLSSDINLKLKASRSWSFGFVQDHYCISE